MPDETQALYDELSKRGVFKSDPEAQAIGHELRRRGIIKDPTQGGLVTPPKLSRDLVQKAPAKKTGRAAEFVKARAAELGTTPEEARRVGTGNLEEARYQRAAAMREKIPGGSERNAQLDAARLMRPWVHAVAKVAQEQATPQNLAIIAGMTALSGTGVPELAVLGKALQVGFGLQGAQMAAQSAKQYAKTKEPEDAIRAVLGAGMAVGGIHGARELAHIGGRMVDPARFDVRQAKGAKPTAIEKATPKPEEVAKITRPKEDPKLRAVRLREGAKPGSAARRTVEHNLPIRPPYVKGEKNAVPVEKPETGVLRQERSEVGLREVGKGDEEKAAPRKEESNQEVKPPPAPTKPVEAAKPVPVPENTIGVRNEDTRREAAIKGMDEKELQHYQGIGESYFTGKDAVETQKIKPDELAKGVIEKPRPLTATEIGALGFHRWALSKAYDAATSAVDEAIKSGDASAIDAARSHFLEVESQFQANTDALQVGGREQSAAFNARKLQIHQDGSLADVKMRARAAKGADLTPKESAKLEQLVKDYNAATTEIERLKASEAQRQAQAELEKVSTRARANTRTQKRTDLKAEREDLHAQLTRLIRGEPSKTAGLPKAPPGSKTGAVDLGALANWPEIVTTIGKLAVNYSKEGAITLDELTDKIRAAVPELSVRNIHDALSGYGRASENRQASEAATRLASLKKEARLLSQLEDEKEGINTAGNNPYIPKDTPEHAAIREEINQIRQERKLKDDIARVQERLRSGNYQTPAKPDATPKSELQQKLSDLRQQERDAIKERNIQAQIKDVQEQLDTGNFKPIPARTPAAKSPSQVKLESLRGQLARAREAATPDTKAAEAKARREAILQAKIADAEAQIKSGVAKPTAKRPAPTRSEAQQRLADLNAELAKMRRKQESEKTAVARAKAAGEKREAAKQERLKKTIAELEKQIHDQKFPTKEPKTPRNLSADEQRLKDLRKQVRDATKPPPKPRKPLTDEQYNKRRLAAVNKQIADMQERIATGNFAPKAKPAARSITPELAQALQTKDALSRQIREATNALVPKTAMQKLLMARTAGLVSAPRTVAKVALAHTLSIPAEELSKYPAAVLDAVYSRVSGKPRTVVAPRVSDVLSAAKVGATTGVKDSLIIALHGEIEALKRGVKDIGTDLPHLMGDMKTGTPYLDKYIKVNTRPHAVAYRSMRMYAWVRSIQEQARLAGINNKLSPAEVKALMDAPTTEMAANAALYAEEQVFLNDTFGGRIPAAVKTYANAYQKKTGQSINWGRWIDYVMPIAKVPMAVAGRSMEYLGVNPEQWSRTLKVVTRQELTPTEQRNFAKAFGRQTAGVGLMALGAKLASTGAATGFGKRKDGKPEASILIGGKWRNIGVLGPVGPVVILGATAYEQWQNPKGFDASNIVKGAVQEFPYTRMSEQLDAVTSAGGMKKISKAAGGEVGSFVPTWVSDVAAQMDEVVRKTENAWDVVKNRVPGLRKTLPPTDVKETNKLFDPLASRAPGEKSTQTPGRRGYPRVSNSLDMKIR